jgi:CRP/FNR family cyclic AMP-dependent transcriptional regulator
MDKSRLKPGHLKRIKSLAVLDDVQLASFLNFVEVVNLTPAASLFREGQLGDSMFLILEGQMRISIEKRNSHEALLLRILEAGDAFGEIALLGRTPRSATVEAMQNTVLIQITADALQRLMSEQPALAAQFLFHLAKNLGRELNDLTVKLRTRSEQADLLSHCR